MTVTDVRHEKTDLKVFIVVIPKEGLAGWGSAHPSLGMTMTIQYYYRLTASSTDHFCNEDVFSRSRKMKCMQWVLYDFPMIAKILQQTGKRCSTITMDK